MSRTGQAGLPAVLIDACEAAERAYATAMASMTLTERRSKAGIGADGTETFLLDEVVEAPVLDVLERHGVNVLSEEVGWIDRGSAVTVVMDPVDGTANAAAGVPLACFAGAVVVDDQIQSALTSWFGGHRRWSAVRGERTEPTVTDRLRIDDGAISLLRPREATWSAWTAIAQRAERVRVLGTSVLEGCLVAEGAIDAFCDPGGDIHRIVDIAAAQLIVEAAGGVVIDAAGRPFDFEPDLTKRWSGIFAATTELAEDLADTIQRSRVRAEAPH